MTTQGSLQKFLQTGGSGSTTIHSKIADTAVQCSLAAVFSRAEKGQEK